MIIVRVSFFHLFLGKVIEGTIYQANSFIHCTPKNNVHVVAYYLQNLNLILNRNENILKQHVLTWAGKLHVLY